MAPIFFVTLDMTTEPQLFHRVSCLIAGDKSPIIFPHPNFFCINVSVADNKPQKYKYTPARHRIHYQDRRRHHRRKNAQSRQSRFRHRSTGCNGVCRNMFSCMFSGHKVDWDRHDSCPGMMDTCCTSWGQSKRSKKYTKSGRSLGPFSPQVQVRTSY